MDEDQKMDDQPAQEEEGGSPEVWSFKLSSGGV